MTDAHHDLILHSTDARGVHQVCLNRPDAFNALSSEVMTVLQKCFDAIAQDPQARVVVLSAKGKAFCALQRVGCNDAPPARHCPSADRESCGCRT